MKLHIFPASPNARKTMMMNAELGLGIEEVVVDLQAGAQYSPEFAALNPNSKIPVLEYDDGTTLWESNAIVNRLAAETDTPLWPKSNVRYDIMRWQFWETAHWTPACGKYISKHLFKNDSVDLEAAGKDLEKFARVLDGHLAGRDWLVGDGMTTADVSASAILVYRGPCQMPIDGYANILRWLGNVEATASWKSANVQPQAA